MLNGDAVLVSVDRKDGLVEPGTALCDRGPEASNLDAVRDRPCCVGRLLEDLLEAEVEYERLGRLVDLVLEE